MKSIKAEDWKPADGLILENIAIETIQSLTNCLIIAGPGAGKTELLAQKACYLLQTNICEFPKKILAISFKRDAAFNLKERVKLRCGEELTKRFDSFTFDAFAKQFGKSTQTDPLPPNERDPLWPFQIDPLIPAQTDPLKMR